jgi:phosphoribosylglycinamide formyltransferase-1
MTQPFPVVVLLSGRGSNMRVLAEQTRQGKLPIDLRAVISDKADAGGLALARDFGIDTATLTARDYANREAFDAALATQVESYAPRLVVLAGYMRILSGAFVRQFLGRLVNIHPSLLPKYPGLHTHRRALEAGDKEHGATVHFATEELDAGPAILQGRVSVMADDTEATLSARVQQAEHIIYAQAVAWFAEGRIAMRDGRTWLDDKLLATTPVIDVGSK